jgi:hypothetical protein
MATEPTFAEQRATFQEEKEAAKARNLAISARRRREASNRPASRPAVRHSSAPIKWLREPARIGGIAVVGVAADAADDVKERYL